MVTTPPEVRWSTPSGRAGGQERMSVPATGKPAAPACALAVQRGSESRGEENTHVPVTTSGSMVLLDPARRWQGREDGRLERLLMGSLGGR
jgi:hypothetical protein